MSRADAFAAALLAWLALALSGAALAGNPPTLTLGGMVLPSFTGCYLFANGSAPVSCVPAPAGGGLFSVGTSGATIPLNSTNNVESGSWIFGAKTSFGGALSGNAVVDLEANGAPSNFNPVGWLGAYNRSAINITAPTSSPGSFHGCAVNTPGSIFAEYDCAWYEAIAYSHGTPSLGSNVVGLRDEAVVPPTNATGAIWGGIDYATIMSGGDGQAIGREIDVTNNGSNVLFPTASGGQKVGLWLATLGPVPSSTAIGISPGSNWNNGFWASANGLTSAGGFLWLDDNAGNAVFKVDKAGFASSTGFTERSGATGAFGPHHFNMSWSGSATNLWIDSTSTGTISVTSDPRVKHDIVTMADGALDQVMALRPVTFNWADTGIFRDDHKRHSGFVAPEVQTVVPDAVFGEAGAVNPDGTPALQSINPLPLISVVTKAVQELRTIQAAGVSCPAGTVDLSTFTVTAGYVTHC